LASGPVRLQLPHISEIGAKTRKDVHLYMVLARHVRSCISANGCNGNAGSKGMRNQFDEPDVEDMQGYIEDRAHLLNKALVDHTVWCQSLEQFGRDASLAATWIDHEGQDHVVAINRAYLKAHLTIVRSLMNDLIACGPEGKRIVQSIISLQVSMLEEEETG
jgi:hypothetical protein